MSHKYYYDVQNVVAIVGCSRSYAYKLIRKLNNELASDDQKYITVSGKVPKAYFDKRLYLCTNENETEKT